MVVCSFRGAFERRAKVMPSKNFRRFVEITTPNSQLPHRGGAGSEVVRFGSRFIPHFLGSLLTPEFKPLTFFPPSWFSTRDREAGERGDPVAEGTGGGRGSASGRGDQSLS